MSASIGNQALAAAAPALIAVWQAVKQFEIDIGTDPTQFPVTVPAAKLKFAGTLGLELPVVAKAEVGLAEGLIGKQADAAIANLQALQAQQTASPAAAAS
jgi:hypothetical protein